MRFFHLVILLALLGVQPVAANQRPNIVIMLADDLGWSDVGFHGGEIDTPSLDRLAAEGVELSRFYTTPICSPTRAALMTGRDPMRLGVAYAVIMPWMNIGIHPREHFMPQTFQAAGYQTAMVGKWHLGHALQAYHPNERGFDHFYGHLHTEVGYFPPFANQGGKDFQQNGRSIERDGYETFILAEEVSRFIRERDRERPFFLYMPFIALHTPLDAPEDLQRKYAGLEDTRQPARSKNTDESRQINRLMMIPSARPMYAAVVDAMDQAIGQVLNTLDEEGLAEDTIVLFFSDNGGAAYATGGADNVPLRGGKGETWEVVAEMASAVHYWRTLYPVAGTRSELVPPPGWRAPKDWASYPRSVEETQEQAAPGMPPAFALKPLDWQHGEAGRLIYNCEPYAFIGGGLCK